jgi:effector-binding domain-containing protein
MLHHETRTTSDLQKGQDAKEVYNPSKLSEERSQPDLRPEIVNLPEQRMAVLRTLGDPERLLPFVLPPLYSSVYALNCERKKSGKDFSLEHFRVRRLDADLLPRAQWHVVWGLPIPEDTASLPQRFSRVRVEIETWKYGTVAQLVYKGPSSSTGRARQEQAIICLKDYINRHDYEISGPLEEEYLVGPEPKIQRTRLRFPATMRKHTADVPYACRALCLSTHG